MKLWKDPKVTTSVDVVVVRKHRFGRADVAPQLQNDRRHRRETHRTRRRSCRRESMILHVAQLSQCLQLGEMGLTEVPCELFRMKNVKQLWFHRNNLCSLPSEISRLTTLEKLGVRLSKPSGAI
jgi:Leucine-rich repeat (LRR) protein